MVEAIDQNGEISLTSLQNSNKNVSATKQFTLLEPDEEQQITVTNDGPSYVYFEVPDACKITLESWEEDLDSFSNTSIYVTVNDDADVGAQNYTWASEHFVEQIEIFPDEDKFETGTYRVAYVTHSLEPVLLNVTIKLSPPESIISLNAKEEPIAH